MSEKQETSADIIAEMRLGSTGDMPFAYRIGRPDRIVEYKTEDGKKYVQRSTVIESVTIDELADRLEAATRRDCAKLREALRECAQYIACVGGIGVGEVTINDNVHLIPEELTQKAIAALSATEKEGGAK